MKRKNHGPDGPPPGSGASASGPEASNDRRSGGDDRRSDTTNHAVAGDRAPVTSPATDTQSFCFGENTTTVRYFSDPHTAVSPADSAGRGLTLCDRNVQHLVPEDTEPLILPGGEPAKRWAVVEQMLSEALDRGLTRASHFTVVGGGALCDAAAFAASIYMRGVAVELVPTTLLAMVDASLGGKTGINFRNLKNLIGTFHAAREIRICPATLESLSDREYFSGLAEVIKAAALGDATLLDLLDSDGEAVRARDRETVREMVHRSIAVKAGVVEADFRESGRRAVLNLGHTFAHALESSVGLGSWTHGAAVAWGIERALALGLHLGTTDPDYAARLAGILKRYGYARGPLAEVEPIDLVTAMRHDKKSGEDSLYFVIQSGPCNTAVLPVSDADVYVALAAPAVPAT